jgi:hypothetical protein
MQIEAKLETMGLMLPATAKAPPGIRLSFDWVRVHNGRAYVSGHRPLNTDGSVAGPFGKVEARVSTEHAYEAARLTALAVLARLKRELGDLDRVAASLTVHGMVNAEPGRRSAPT